MSIYLEILNLDPVFLSRIQFALVVTFHIIFPSFTIGLAIWLTILEGMWLKTQNPMYKELYKMWIKIFAVAFGMGVVSGVVMSYQFGTNWSVFSDKVGNVLGPLLGYEVLTAFFLEASFLGIMLFGWGRVSPRMHFFSTFIVAAGTVLSAFWILAANSWMHTPSGFELAENGILYPTDWLEIIFNPSFKFKFAHMLIAAFLTTSFVIGGVGAYYFIKKKHLKEAKIMLTMSVFIAFFMAPIQALVGDAHGLNTLKHQPVKIAAIEGLWHTEKGAGLRLFAIPEPSEETNKYEIIIPKLSSLILTHSFDGEIKGLTNWAPSERPPVTPVFFGFRIMVGIGLLMILAGLIGTILFIKKRLYDSRWFHIFYVLMAPCGFIAIIAGWFVAEIGRQPYVVYGILRTADTASPVIGEYILISIIAFFLVYLFVFGSGIYYILSLIRKGPKIVSETNEYFGQNLQKSEFLSGDNKIDQSKKERNERNKNTINKHGIKRHI